MIIKKAELSAVGVIMDQYPKNGMPEIALCGRSNVGKSSLINSLVNRKALARVSSVPGKTRTINFYNINDLIHLVDLPGYGYAKVSRDEKAKWGKMIEDYLYQRHELKLVVLIVDIRHNPTADDKLMHQWMKHSGCQVIVVATKADKISKNALFKNISVIKKDLNLTKEDIIIPFSSETKQGREELLNIMEEMCLGDNPTEE